MPEQNDDLLSSILRRIPGFGGYVHQEQRQASDDQTRKWLADHFQRAKSELDRYARQLTGAGQLDDLTACEKLRSRIDHLQARIRSTVQNYRSFLESKRIDEDQLEDVYDCDAWLLDEVDRFTSTVSSLLKDGAGTPASGAPVSLDNVEKKLAEIQSKFDERERLLKSLNG